MRLRFILASGVACLLIMACSGAPAASPTPASGNIDATLSEWQISLSSNTVAAGDVTFHIANTGEKTHEFVVVRTDVAEGDLPVVDDEIPEDSDLIEAIDEVEDIEAGTTDGSLTVNLTPGHYVIFCNLTAHYGKGMHATVNVQ